MNVYTTRLPSHAGLPAAFADLSFLRMPLATARQARLRGRFALCPEIDLTLYRFEAVIDYVKIAFTSHGPSQMRHVQNAFNAVTPSASGKVPWVKRVDGTDASALGFEVTIQDPVVRELAECDRMLRTRFGMTTSARVVELEVSLDVYPRSGSDDDRGRMVGALQRCYLPKFNFLDDAQARPRFATGKTPAMQHLYKWHDSHQARKALTNGDPDAWLKPESAHSPYVDTTLYIGAKEGDELIRIQSKVTNRRSKGVADDLVQKEKRARVEVRLRGAALSQVGLADVAELLGFDFATLQKKYFHFVFPSFPNEHGNGLSSEIQKRMNNLSIAHFLKTGAVGMILVETGKDASRRRPAKDGTGKTLNAALRERVKASGRKPATRRAGTGVHGSTLAFPAMNDRMREALRNLCARSKTQLKPNVAASVSKPSKTLIKTAYAGKLGAEVIESTAAPNFLGRGKASACL
ncbi:MAG: hypothetical protein ACK47C_10205 [Paracoccaceae bacterium]